MRPDLRNVIAVTEAGKGSGRKVFVRHRAFTEIQAEGESPREALLALQSILKVSSGWVSDAWHAAALAQAIFDLESILWLLDCSDHAMIHGGHDTTLMKNEDLIYYSSDSPVEDLVVPGNQDDHRPGLVEPQCDAAPTRSVLIYSAGRRRATRRQPWNGEEPRTRTMEQRRFDRRKCDRRQYHRISLIADIPKTSDELRLVGTERANLPTSALT